MSLILSGTDGLSDVDGTAATPAIRGTDANTGIFFGTDIIGFSEGGVEAMRINASGNLQTIATIGVGGATPSTSGAGITFPATQSASTEANTLDDYEEGTWTPVLGTSNGGTATMSVQEGWYVKIGKFVQFSAQVVWTAKNTWDFNTRISGLPFAARSNTTNYGWPNACQMESNLTTTPFVYSIEANTTQGYVNQIYALAQLGESNFPTSGRVLINGCYQVA